MTEKAGTGIIVGRFQVVDLNDAHKELIDHVRDSHEKVAVFLCSNPAPSDMNPIDLLFRIDLIESHYGEEIELFEMEDLPDDRIWSQELDRRILEMRPVGKVLIYGTEEGFTSRYSGRYDTEVLEANETENLDIFSIDEDWDPRSFRAGMLFASMRRFPTVYPTVDIAVFRDNFKEVLLARKENETKLRFPGGFTDPMDDSFEMAVMRELSEECGDIEVENLVYVGSSRIDDWRYRDSLDTIITHLYVCSHVSGTPEATDDIEDVKWVKIDSLRKDLFVPEHRDLWDLLTEFLEEENEGKD
jgi:bifunctional NMN adenylyltransferase/nudix hydrolase